MTIDPNETARRWSQHLPREFARQLAAALRDGHAAVHSLLADAVLPGSTAAVQTALHFVEQGQGPYVGGVLCGRLDALAEHPQITPVWTGPESERDHGRLTLAVIADLIAEAQREILLASYAAVPSDAIRQALHTAVERHVAITLLLERAIDNPQFNSPGDPFPGLAARRLTWPANVRPPGAAMHAKLLIIDRQTALVGSANLTGHALERNLECGLLIRGGRVPALLVGHLLSAQGLRPA